MKIIIVRHGDPDYVHDSLTEQGVLEAKAAAEYLSNLKVDYVYCSPLGRAQKTASYYLEKTGKECVTLDFLREFQGNVREKLKKKVCWDRMPDYWTQIDEYYDYKKWLEVPLMKKNSVKKYYDWVTEGTRCLIEKHGYVKNGRLFDVKNGNDDTILLFCHFGVECVILSELFSISPMILWHNFRSVPTGITTIVTEEREKGKAMFVALEFASTAHLYKAGLEPSFAARFCEKFEDDTRH